MFGSRLKLARKKAGLSMQGLAELVEPRISSQAVSKYESGKMMPSSSVLMSLSKVLGTSLDFLMGGQVEELVDVEFRKHSKTSAKDRARAEAIVIEMLENYLAIEEILEIPEEVDSISSVRKDSISSFEEAEGAAIELRRRWDLGLDPIFSVTSLLEDKGIRVIEADLPERFDGLTCTVKRNHGRHTIEVIVVSSRSTIERKRFNLAHELAHRVVRSTTENLPHEKAMHRFAAAFLVPSQHLKMMTGEKRSGFTVMEIIKLKQYYGISAAAMVVRLRDTGLLSKDKADYAFRSYAGPWRNNEPNPIASNEKQAEFESPRRFKGLVWRALGEQIITSVRAAQLLNQSLEMVENAIRGPIEA